MTTSDLQVVAMPGEETAEGKHPHPSPESGDSQPSTDSSHSRTSPKPLPAAAVKPHQTSFFDIPFEIREHIFLLALLAQANMFWHQCPPHEIRLRPWPGLQEDQGREFWWAEFQKVYWGTRYWSKMLPVCKQWYNEIIVVFFGKLDFYVYNTVIFENRLNRPFCLEFFPRVSLTTLRRLFLICSLFWNPTPQHREKTATLLQSYRDIAREMTGLTNVTILFHHFDSRDEYDWAPEDMKDDPWGKTGKRGDYKWFPDRLRYTILDMMLNFSRPFKHVLQLNLNSFHCAIEPYPELWTRSSTVMIILDLRRIVAEEIRLDKEASIDSQ